MQYSCKDENMCKVRYGRPMGLMRWPLWVWWVLLVVLGVLQLNAKVFLIKFCLAVCGFVVCVLIFVLFWFWFGLVFNNILDGF